MTRERILTNSNVPTFQRSNVQTFPLPVLLAGLGLLLTLLFTGCNPLPTLPDRVFIVADGERRALETRAGTVREVLVEADITLEGLDRLQPPETAQIQNGMTITVTRVLERWETITETLPFERQVVRDATIPEGETRLLQVGQAGVRERVTRILLEDGVEKERALVQDTITRPPQDEVRLIGTRPQATTASITGTLAYLEHQDAWVMRSSTANHRRLTAFGDLAGRVFALSPDGTRLLFTRVVTEGEHFNALWLVHTTEADAAPVPLELDDVIWAGWSPDGEKIAWTTAEPTERAPGWRGRNDLWVAALSSRDRLISKREILKPEAGGGYGWWGARYAWSPTGNALAYATPEEVGVVTLAQRERLPLARFPAYRTYSSWAWSPGLAWSPDGGFIATVLHGPAPGEGEPEESPVFDLWILAATGAYSTEIASEVGMWAAPQFSPDGETLLFGKANIPYQSQLSSYTLCTVDRDGSNRSCFYPAEGETGIEIPLWIWSPDQQALVFIQRDNLQLLQQGEKMSIPITGEGRVTAVDWR